MLYKRDHFHTFFTFLKNHYLSQRSIPERSLILYLETPFTALPVRILQMYHESLVKPADFGIVMFFMGMASWIFFRYITDHFEVSRNWVKFFIGASFCIVAWVILIELPDLKSVTPARIINLPFRNEEGLILNRAFLLGFMMLSIILFFESFRRTKKEKKEMDKLLHEKLLSQLNILRQQINPHFLFNSLNVLRSGSSENWVKEYVMELSKVYRYLLNYNNGADLMQIDHELEFLRAYIYILQERFEKGLVVNIDIASQAKTKSIPILALQILVENAVKHNIVSLSRPLHIRIYSEGDNLVVTNNRQIKRQGYRHNRTRTGLGLNNLDERYYLIANNAISIVEEENSFTVKIPMIE